MKPTWILFARNGWPPRWFESFVRNCQKMWINLLQSSWRGPRFGMARSDLDGNAAYFGVWVDRWRGVGRQIHRSIILFWHVKISGQGVEVVLPEDVQEAFQMKLGDAVSKSIFMVFQCCSKAASRRFFPSMLWFHTAWGGTWNIAVMTSSFRLQAHRQRLLSLHQLMYGEAPVITQE